MRSAMRDGRSGMRAGGGDDVGGRGSHAAPRRVSVKARAEMTPAPVLAPSARVPPGGRSWLLQGTKAHPPMMQLSSPHSLPNNTLCSPWPKSLLELSLLNRSCRPLLKAALSLDMLLPRRRCR